jgi:ankyrin repeat protein
MRKLVFCMALAAVLAPVWLCAQGGPFFDTVKDGSPEAVRAAIAQGASVNGRETSQGKTPLIWAVQFNNNPEVTAVLLKAGARLEDKDLGALVGGKRGPAYGWTALMWAAASCKSPEVITLLVKAHANVKVTDNQGLTALMVAAENNPNPEVVTRLLKIGLNLEAKDSAGYTALIKAASKNSPEVIIALLKAGANAKAKNGKGYSALDYAKYRRDLEGTEALKMLEKASR